MWELIFLMVILKIPIIYLGWVVYWAVKSKPEPAGGEPLGIIAPPPLPVPSLDPRRRHRRPRQGRPHGGPSRGYARTRRVAGARSR